MHATHSRIYDVVIVGAGPVGLFLACELRLAGVAVLVLEQAVHAQSPLKRLPFGMRGLSVATLEAFDRRGLLDDVAAAQGAADASGPGTSTAAHWLRQPRRAAGHFAGIQFFHDRIDTSQWKYHLASPAGTGLPVAMQTLEAVLERRASGLGAEIRRGFGVEALDQSGDGVTICAGGETFRSDWLVGCDGGRSMVRKLAEFEFVGTEPEFTGYSIEVEMADPNVLLAGRHFTPTGMYTYTSPGTVAMADFDGGAFHRTGPVTIEHAQAVLRHVTGTDVTLTALHLGTTWTDRALQATAYRKGRVLLAGDAAHVHSPLGGQGLNLGLGDAMNLAWKLAAAIRGDAPVALLDSYEGERHPVGAQILDWSRAQVALMRPSRSSRALGKIMQDLMETRDGATYFAERVWGVGLRYDLGDGHPLLGRIAPDLQLADGRLNEHLRTGRSVLLDFGADASLRGLAGRWGDRVDYVDTDAGDRLGLGALFVRPDGIVAWAADGVADHDGAARAMSLWLGHPR